jgi:hypothetical protein
MGGAQVLEFSPTTPFPFGTDISAGWAFTTNQAITVTALDAFDPSGTGSVRLYNAADTLLASATVTTADPIEGSPTLFYSQAITPVNLAADTTYFLAQDMSANVTTFQAAVSGLSTNPAITYDGAVSAFGLSQDPISDNVFSGSANPGFFGPNFDMGSQAPGTPEPGTLALFSGLTVTGLGFAIKRRRTR